MNNNEDINDLDHSTDLDDVEHGSSNKSLAIIVFLGMGFLVLGFLAYKLLASEPIEDEAKKPLKEEKTVVDIWLNSW